MSHPVLHALRPHQDRILTPALVLDLDAVRANVAAVLQRVGDPSRWRPHLKTVKSGRVVDILLQAGLRHFKVATEDELELALSRARAAGTDPPRVLLARPALGPHLARARALARHYPGQVELLLDGPEHVARVAAGLDPGERVAGWPDVDLGMGRTGRDPRAWADLLAQGLPAGIELAGLHAYDGHLTVEDAAAARAGYDALSELAAATGVGEVVTSGTHSYGHALAHPGLGRGSWRHQISPGTVILSDRRSAPAAADLGLRQAAFVLARVISRPGEGRLTLDAGSKAIAPDCPAPGLGVVGHPELLPQPRSEEHLPVRIRGATDLRIGDLVLLVPDHVCTTVNLYREALWVEDGRLVGHGPIEAHSRRTWLGAPVPGMSGESVLH